MKKIDPTVTQETRYIALSVIVLSAVMELIFLMIGKWDTTVLFGNLLSGCAAVLNFFLMGITVQKSLEKEEKEAKDTVKLSQTLRSFFQFGVLVFGVALPCFNIITAIVPLFFPRIAIMARPLWGKM